MDLDLSASQRSYLGISIIAIIGGSLVLFNILEGHDEAFQLLENRHPAGFEDIISGYHKAFAVAGLVRHPIQLLRFRFSHLVEARIPSEYQGNLTTSSPPYMAEIEPLLELSRTWNQTPEKLESEIEIDEEALKITIYDFTMLLNATGLLTRHPETITTFALLTNSTGGIHSYYKGISGFAFENRTEASIVHLSIKIDESEMDYYPPEMASAYKALSLEEGPKLGTISITEAERGSSVRVAYTFEAPDRDYEDSIQIARVYVNNDLAIMEMNHILGVED